MSNKLRLVVVAVIVFTTEIAASDQTKRPTVTPAFQILPSSEVAWIAIAQRQSTSPANQDAWYQFARTIDAAKAHPDWAADRLLATAKDFRAEQPQENLYKTIANDLLSVVPYHPDLLAKWAMEFSRFSDDYALSTVGANRLDTAHFGATNPAMWEEIYSEVIKSKNRLGAAFDYLSNGYFGTTIGMSANEMLSQYPDLQANARVSELLASLDTAPGDKVAEQARTESISDLNAQIAASLQTSQGTAYPASQPAAPLDANPSRSQEEKRINERAAELQDEIYIASAMTQLFVGDEKTKHNIQQGLNIASAGVKAWQSISLYSVGVIGASAASAGVLGATLTVASALQKQQSGGTETLEAIQELSKQLSQLHEDMMKQFTIVNEKLDSIYWYSSKTYQQIAELSYNLNETRRNIGQMQDTLFEIQRGTEEARDEIINSQRERDTAICFHYKSGAHAISERDLVACTAILVDAATTAKTHPVIFTDFSIGKLREGFHDRPLPETAGSAYSLQRAVTAGDLNSDFALTSFPNWAAQVALYLQFAKLYEKEYVAHLPGWQNDVNLLRQPGVALRHKLISLLGGNVAERKAFLDFLVQGYADTLASAVTEVKSEQDHYFRDAVSVTENLESPQYSRKHPPCPLSTYYTLGGPPPSLVQRDSSEDVPDATYDKFPSIIKNRGGKLDDGSYLMGPPYLCVTQYRMPPWNPMAPTINTGPFTEKMTLWVDGAQLDAFDVDFPNQTTSDVHGNALSPAQYAALWSTEMDPYILAKVNGSTEKMRSAIDAKMRTEREYRRRGLEYLANQLQLRGQLKRIIEELTIRKEILYDFVALSLPETAYDDKVRSFLANSSENAIFDMYGFARMIGCTDVACERLTNAVEIRKDQPDALAQWPEVLMQERFQLLKSNALPVITSGLEKDQP